MAKIVITIKDEMPVNGLNGVTISYDGDLEPQGELTMAQMTAYNIKKLMDAVGEEAAGRLERAYAGQPFLAIPRCWDAMRELRNRFIRRQYDAMSAEGLSDLVIVRELVLAHRLSTRNIRYILKEADREAAARAQTDLFVA